MPRLLYGIPAWLRPQRFVGNSNFSTERVSSWHGTYTLHAEAAEESAPQPAKQRGAAEEEAAMGGELWSVNAGALRSMSHAPYGVGSGAWEGRGLSRFELRWIISERW